MKDALKLIGNTPMFHIEDTNIYVKLEKFNAGGSIKDRAVLGMLQNAFDHHLIKEDTVLIEATSGNTGIALSMLGAVYKLPVIIVMPDDMSQERIRLMQAYGANVILSEGRDGMSGAIAYMEQLKQEHKNYLSLSQFENEANVNAHYETTGKEIIEQVKDIDIFVACVGTGGTFTGIAKRLKEYNPKIHCVAGEPQNSAVISGHEKGNHQIQGIGAGFIPSILNQKYMDDLMMVSDEEAIKETIAFGKETGILVGISSGANIALAKRLASYYPNKKIVTVAPDGAEKYLSVLDFSSE